MLVVAAAWFAFSQTHTLTLTTTLPSPAAVFNNVITTGGNTNPPSAAQATFNNTYLNRTGGDTIFFIPPNGSATSGHVGIGTTNPSARLDVTQGVIRALDNGVNNLPGSGTGLELYALSNVAYIGEFIRPTTTNQSLSLNATYGGQIQIGGTSSIVTIAGGQPLVLGGVVLYVNGDAVSHDTLGHWSGSSDARLKDIRGAFSAGLKEVLALQPVRFKYKRDNPLGLRADEENIGLVAQNVQKSIPEAVRPDSKGYLMFRSDPVLWAMLNAIKEQQLEIEDLRARIHARRHGTRSGKAR